MNDVTRILGAIQHGDPKAAEELLPLVYEELRHRLFQERTCRASLGPHGRSRCEKMSKLQGRLKPV